jgi:diguanylate cyclase (GGDEF)-like protein
VFWQDGRRLVENVATGAPVLVALFLIVHAGGILAFPSHSTAVSDLVRGLAPIIPVVGCALAARSVGWVTGWKWVSLAAALILWDAGFSLAAWEDLLEDNTTYVSTLAGFIYFLFGVPLLLAIGASRNDRHIPAVVWVDGALAVAIGLLAYRDIFVSLPGTDGPNEMVAAVRVAYVYDAENVLLALLASVRLLAADSLEERAFYRCLALYLSIYALTAAFYNHVVLLGWQANANQLWDLLPDVPSLILAVGIVRAMRGAIGPRRGAARSTTMMIHAGISISLPLVLLIFGLLTIHNSPIVGIISVVGALVAYGLRNVLSQARLMESEHNLISSKKALERAAFIDPLTGVGNRRSFDQSFEREWSRAQRTSKALAVLIFDIDHFKKINDTYGHQRGDELLVAVARALQDTLPRLTEVLARYGGEEFACILPGTDSYGAIKVAERLRAAVEALQLQHPGSPHKVVTVSVGVAVCQYPVRAAPSLLFGEADRALYEAKRNGRNRVELARSPRASGKLAAG